MAVTRRSLTLLHELRTEVGSLADRAVREIGEAWLAAWDDLSEAWRAALAAAVDVAVRTGRWPSGWQLARIPEVAAAVEETEQSANALVVTSTAAIVAATGAAVTAAAMAQPLIIASQMPSALAGDAGKTFAAKVQPGPLTAIRKRTGSRATTLTKALTGLVNGAAKRALVRGTPLQAGPGAATATVLGTIEAGFLTGSTRAATIARTETLDAARQAAAYADEANADILDGWIWTASLGPRCCPACWSLHGTTFPLSVPGPEDHQNGRCSRIPALKPWVELNIIDPERASVLPDAQARFRRLSRTDQLQIMGAARLQMLDDGEIGWADLAAKRSTQAWRDSWTPRSVAELRRIAGRRHQ